VKITHNGNNCLTLLSWSYLSEHITSVVLLDGQKPHCLWGTFHQRSSKLWEREEEQKPYRVFTEAKMPQ